MRFAPPVIDAEAAKHMSVLMPLLQSPVPIARWRVTCKLGTRGSLSITHKFEELIINRTSGAKVV